jgi:hypothetical protein
MIQKLKGDKNGTFSDLEKWAKDPARPWNKPGR